MNTEIRSWELVDKVLVAGLLSVIKPHQQKVSFADIWQSHYAPTYHLTTLYLSRLVRSGYLSVYQGAEGGGQVDDGQSTSLRLEPSINGDLLPVLIKELADVDFSVMLSRQVAGLLLRQIMVGECFQVLGRLLENNDMGICHKMPPPVQISNILCFNSIQQTCTALSCSVEEAYQNNGKLRLHAHGGESFAEYVSDQALSNDRRYLKTATRKHQCERDESHRISAISYVITEICLSVGSEYFCHEKLWQKSLAHCDRYDSSLIFPDPNPSLTTSEFEYE